MKRSSTKYVGYWNVLRALPQESHAIAYFTKVRWQQGEFCPYCAHNKIYHLKDRKTHKCAACRRIFSITVGTIFEGTKLPLSVWILTIALLCDHGGRLGSTELIKHFRISQRSAWHLLERLRQATLTLSFQGPLAKELKPRRAGHSNGPSAKKDPSFRWREAAEKADSDTAIEHKNPSTPELLAKSSRQWLRSHGKQPFVVTGDEVENSEVEKILEQLHRARGLGGGLGHPRIKRLGQ